MYKLELKVCLVPKVRSCWLYILGDIACCGISCVVCFCIQCVHTDGFKYTKTEKEASI